MFKSRLRRLSVFLALAVAAGSMMTDQTETQAGEGASPLVTFETTHGSFAVALEPESAPKTVENFLTYVRDGHFDGTIFHRIIAGFMIQGGGFTQRFEQLQTRAPIENEAPDAPGNDRGTIAMARTADPHSATAQFFINVVDNDFLNHRGKNPQGWGYAAFGRVVDGMETVDRIAALQ
ncbi:MAG: peptidylprolyl isomerase, partial [Rhodospirillales bacterium]|nr:peptidylprolyl isomerase [Rhodospirillales bacterium]